MLAQRVAEPAGRQLPSRAARSPTSSASASPARSDWWMLDDPASRASRSTVAGPAASHSWDQAIPPNGSCIDTTKSSPRRTTGHIRCTNSRSARTRQWCQTPTAR